MFPEQFESPQVLEDVIDLGVEEFEHLNHMDELRDGGTGVK